MLEGRVAWSAATLLRALSYPHADRADDVAEAIAVRDGRGLLERFLDRYGQRLRLRGNGLAPALESAASALTLHAAWDPWAGAVARSLRRDDPVPERTAVVAALHLTAGGSSLSLWSCFLYEPARLRFGRCLLPTVGLISLSVDGAGVRVATRGPGGEHEVRLIPAARRPRDRAGQPGSGDDLVAGGGARPARQRGAGVPALGRVGPARRGGGGRQVLLAAQRRVPRVAGGRLPVGAARALGAGRAAGP